jgi:hypothetical protein
VQKAIEQIYGYPGNADNNLNDSFNENMGGGGGGGGGYVSPAPPYVPQLDQNPLKIFLTTNDGSAVEFFEDSNSKGIGANIAVLHNPSTAFGSSREYTAGINNGTVFNKFVVSIINFDSFNYNEGNKTYSEGIRITEYKLENGSWIEQQFPRTFNFTSGTITLNFDVQLQKQSLPQPSPLPKETISTIVTNPNPNSQYEISFGCNLQNEIGNALTLSYQIVYGDTIVKNGILSLGNNVLDELSNEILSKGNVNFEIKGNLPDGLSIESIYSGLASQSNGDFNRLNKVPYAFSVPASQLKNSFIVVVDAVKEIKFAEPKITLGASQYTIAVKDSDTEKPVSITFNTENADRVLVYIDSNNPIEVPAVNGSITLYFQKDFKEVYGTKKIALVAESNNFGTGQKAEALITFTAINDFPSITETTFAETIDIPSFSDFNIEYDVKYSTFAASSVDIWLKLKNGSSIGLFSNQPSNGSVKINLKKLRDLYPNWSGSDNVTLILKPYNRSGAEALSGNDYEIVTKLILPTIYLDDDILTSALFDSFIQKLSVIEPDKDSKYLTHLANFGDDNQIIVSSWENDNWTLSKKSEDDLGNIFIQPKDEVESIILKLYSPLTANITSNSTFWITKLMSNPLIETVVLNEQSNLICPPLKGPNFDIDVDFVSGKSTNYESLDNLILSGSTSSNQLITQYLSSSIIDTTDLNIEYASGSTYVWNNFVHFSSAKERVDNFVYKVQLIEGYENLIVSASTDTMNTGFINSPASQQEVERQTLKKNTLIQSFDGFEKFLYSTSSMSWPYNGTTRRLSTSIQVTNWYEDITVLAEDFDIENPNWVQNNIPQFIVNNEDNASLLLFFSMIGHHFDNIYFHTKSIEKSRGLGYKAKDGISDKLLFDALKSFGWDAKNLAADEHLWNYVFGVDKEGNSVNTIPTSGKTRTNEVWRRIINNLPYLLKHKGTRKGVYALLSCYGIPSSNLSILEFGGPEVGETTKSKLILDNVTSALKMVNGSYLEMEWKNTDKNRKPDTIEFFTKPSTSGNYQIVSGSGWNLQLSGSVDSNYGKVLFNYSGSNQITSSLLPIFNGKFFGVEVSREVSGSYHNFELNIRQSDKERSIFQQSISSSILNTNSNWNSGSYIRLGNNFSGSLDEFRLWSVPLEKAKFYEHVSFPEMINGNSVSASTSDLYFRLDFEYPKNLAQTASLINVDTNIYFQSGLSRNTYEAGTTASLYSLNPSASFTASAVGFTSVTAYPYQFESVDRSVVLEIPDMGSSRYSTNKVRFESQTLVGDLSYKQRSTKKAFDQSPTDSNRVGLFFSPTKELNIDIAKSFGGINLDNYIGDPADRYKSNYKRLDDLRSYYFERFDGRDIYAYINLIKLYEKSMFEDIKKMLPARVKASTGLLIEPHILERSKIQNKKPTAENYQREVSIHFGDSTILTSENIQNEVTLDANANYVLVAENNQQESVIDANLSENLIAENYQYDSLINQNDTTILNANSYQEEVTIDAGLGEPTITTEIDLGIETYGQSAYETIGFGIYAQNGHSIRTYFDKEGKIVKERIKVDLIKEEKRRDTTKFKTVIGGKGDPRDGMILTSSVYYETTLNIQPYSGSKVINSGTGSIVEVTPLNGYLPTHYRNTTDLTAGLKNSYFLGSKNTAATTLDGTPPIETFSTNPNTLRVNKAGRDISEPILEVE